MANTNVAFGLKPINTRSEEHTSELQSQFRISYAVFCLKKKKTQKKKNKTKKNKNKTKKNKNKMARSITYEIKTII